MDSFDTLTFLQNEILHMDSFETLTLTHNDMEDIDIDIEEEVLDEGYVVSNGWIQFQ